MFIQTIFIASLISEKKLGSMLLIGSVTLIGGLVLMWHQKRQIDSVLANETNERLRLFEQRKFRRRSLANTFVAAIGALMISLYWAIEPAVFLSLVSVVLLLLLAVMFIAFMDLMSVSLHKVADDDSARQRMVDEYLKQRKKLLEHAEDSECG